MTEGIFHIPRYEEFPDIDLYMDQVITYLNKQLGAFSKEEGDVVTSSMINNYVKHGIVPPPEGKKYNRRHLAYMTAVFFLKQSLRMDEIKCVIDYHVSNSDEKKAYQAFCSQLEGAFFSILPEKEIDQFSIEDAGALTLKYSAVAIAGQIYAQKTVGLLNSLAGEKLRTVDKIKDKDKFKDKVRDGDKSLIKEPSKEKKKK